MRIRFGTDGWRGIIAADFTFDNLSVVAQATMEWLREQRLEHRGVVIGYDRRFLSRGFAQRVAEVAAGNGLPVLLADRPCPTPALSWSVRERQAGAGIMITASHNPPEYNGFKLKESFGGPARPSTVRRVEELIATILPENRQVAELPFAQAAAAGKITLFDPKTGYLQAISSCVDMELIRSAGLRVALDPMHGAGSGWLSELLPGACEIHGEENPGFGGRSPEPVAENLQELAEVVRSGRMSAGLALDGDADRIAAVDERGDFFSPQHIFTVLLRHLYERKGLRGAVAKSVSATRMIDILCSRYGLEVLETPIGFKHLAELMLEREVLIAGEESGGFGISGHLPERDGLLMGLLLLEAMAASGKGLRVLLEETMEEIGPFHYRRIDVPVGAEEKERLLQTLKNGGIGSVSGKKVARENFLDGFKFILEDGSWLLIRPSGTEPLLRLYAEAPTPEEVEALLRAATELVTDLP